MHEALNMFAVIMRCHLTYTSCERINVSSFCIRDVLLLRKELGQPQRLVILGLFGDAVGFILLPH